MKQRHQNGVSDFIFNFKLISQLVLVFLLWCLSMYLFALYKLFYISIVFRFDGFRFHPFLDRISTKYNISTKWNTQREKCISFLRWNVNYEVTTLIINELHTFFIRNAFFQLILSVASVLPQYISINILRHFYS